MKHFCIYIPTHNLFGVVDFIMESSAVYSQSLIQEAVGFLNLALLGHVVMRLLAAAGFPCYLMMQ